MDSRTGRSGELVQVLADQRICTACVHQTRWKGNSCKRHKRFCKESKEKNDFVGIFVAKRWLDSVVSVGTASE